MKVFVYHVTSSIITQFGVKTNRPLTMQTILCEGKLSGNETSAKNRPKSVSMHEL